MSSQVASHDIFESMAEIDSLGKTDSDFTVNVHRTNTQLKSIKLTAYFLILHILFVFHFYSELFIFRTSMLFSSALVILLVNVSFILCIYFRFRCCFETIDDEDLQTVSPHSDTSCSAMSRPTVDENQMDLVSPTPQTLHSIIPGEALLLCESYFT